MHRYLQRKVIWTPLQGNKDRLPCQPFIDTIVAWISENDKDSEGNPGFICTRTKMPAPFFINNYHAILSRILPKLGGGKNGILKYSKSNFHIIPEQSFDAVKKWSHVLMNSKIYSHMGRMKAAADQGAKMSSLFSLHSSLATSPPVRSLICTSYCLISRVMLPVT